MSLTATVELPVLLPPGGFGLCGDLLGRDVGLGKALVDHGPGGEDDIAL